MKKIISALLLSATAVTSAQAAMPTKVTPSKAKTAKKKGSSDANNKLQGVHHSKGIPLASIFWELYQQPNKLGINDCSNKSGRLARALRQAGYQADVLIIKPWNSRMQHAVVQVKEDGNTYYLDAVRGTKLSNIDDFGRTIRLIDYDELDLEGTEFM